MEWKYINKETSQILSNGDDCCGELQEAHKISIICDACTVTTIMIVG